MLEYYDKFDNEKINNIYVSLFKEKKLINDIQVLFLAISFHHIGYPIIFCITRIKRYFKIHQAFSRFHYCLTLLMC